jgi:hypothetical protein
MMTHHIVGRLLSAELSSTMGMISIELVLQQHHNLLAHHTITALRGYPAEQLDSCMADLDTLQTWQGLDVAVHGHGLGATAAGAVVLLGCTGWRCLGTSTVHPSLPAAGAALLQAANAINAASRRPEARPC